MHRYPFADEIIAQAADRHVGHHPAVIDARIDLTHRALARGGVAGQQFARADQHLVADLEETGVTLGQGHAQDVVLGGDHRDGLAGHHHAALRHRHLQHHPGGGGEHRALAGALGADLLFGAQSGDGACRHVQAGPRVVDAGLGGGALGQQFLRAAEFDLGQVALGLGPLQAGVDAGGGQRQLGVADGGDAAAGLDPAALVDQQARDGAGDAGAGQHLIDAFHRGEHRLQVVHLAAFHRQLAGEGGQGGQHQGAGQTEGGGGHGLCSE